MTTRVSTYGNHQSALLDLMAAQVRGAEAQNRMATRKVATDLAGFGRESETLTALRATETRLKGFIDTSETVAARLGAQDLAFERLIDGTESARLAIANALATGRMDGLMQVVQGEFQTVQAGLNAQHQGRYLFAGGRIDTVPSTAASMEDLALAPDVASTFANDQLKQVSRIDEGATLESGFLADEVGAEVLEIFRDIQLFHQGTPLTGHIDDTTRTFLASVMDRLDTARKGVVDQAAANGAMQKRVEAILTSQEDQQITLETLLGKKTDADMAKAVLDLEQAQIAIQASAQVVSQLRNMSLLPYLS